MLGWEEVKDGLDSGSRVELEQPMNRVSADYLTLAQYEYPSALNTKRILEATLSLAL